jgi:3-phosphoshikimate 1-carboxyvinyltransferase
MIATPLPINLPGSKSLSLRALFIAALASGESTLKGLANCDDLQEMLRALRELGVATHVVESTTGDLDITVSGCGGIFPEGDVTLKLGLSGVTARLLIGLAILRRGKTTIIGEPSLNKRPFSDLFLALEMLGANIIRSHETSDLPVTLIPPDKISLPRVEIRGETSSQFVSTLFLIAPCLTLTGKESVEIRITGSLTSRPYLEMSMAMMEHFGVKVTQLDDVTFTIKCVGYTGSTYICERDASAATYFMAFAAIHGVSILMPYDQQTLQSDWRFLGICEKLGSKVEFSKDAIILHGPRDGSLLPLGGREDFTLFPDAALTLIAIAPLIPGGAELCGLHTLPFKECNRIASPATELSKLGSLVEYGADWITISHVKEFNEVEIATYHDHRMAMSFGILNSKLKTLTFDNKDVVSKTFPKFWKELARCEEAIKSR